MYRYGLIFRPDSYVTVCKVQHGTQIGLGLKARRRILAGAYIFETCSSLSSNNVKPPGPSIIEAPAGLRDLHGMHSILGSFRIGNHGCDANCQVSSLSLSFDLN